MSDIVQLTPLLLPYAVSAVVTTYVTIYGIRQLQQRRWDKTIASFVGVVGGTTLWTVSRMFELLFVNEALTQFWAAFLYIGYGGGTMSGLFFCLSFIGQKDLLTKRNVGLILVFPTVAVILAVTNWNHNLLWTSSYEVEQGWYGTILVLKRDFQPLFHIYLLYAVGGATLGLVVLLRDALNSPDVYRRQTIAFVVGGAATIVSGLLFALERQPFVPSFIDLTPIGFTVMGLCFGYAIFRHQFLDIVPVARDTVIESMRDGYLVVDSNDRIVDYNAAATEILDAQGEVIGQSIGDLQRECSTVIADHEPGTRLETELTLDIDGEQRFLVADVSSLTRDDKRIGRLLLLRDVTDRRAVQKRYRALIENSSDLILVTEPDGEITYASPSVTNITGVEPDDIIGENSSQFIHPDDLPEFEAAIDELVENPGQRKRQEYRTMDSEGNWLYMEASVWNLLDNPFVEGLVVNAREITERKEREQELERTNGQLTQANEQLEQFASVISHDLRNPINVARGHVDMARNGREESFVKVEDSLQRMEAIIDDVLTLAREGESIGETEPVSLEDRATVAWEHVATDDAELVVVDEASFEADPDRLLQLFENLFRNAHEHVGEDVTVRVGIEDGTLYVEDDGPGIPEDKRDQVLEYGHTTNEDGTGLGLSIVSQIAGAHGWNVTVTEGTEGGARFEFTGILRGDE